VAACVAVVAAVMLAVDGRAALAAVDLWLVLQANIALPLAIHILLQALQGDLRHADLDPLTGLLNRRAFHRQTLSLLARRYEEDRYLIVALVDLDDFKSLNDTLGHSAGDQALVEVAGALRATATPTAVIARSGGEEFLIADVAPSYRAVAVKSQDVCDAIAALTAPVTASIGTAFAALDSSPERDHDGAVDHLIAAADSAMYRAKRSGGNRCHHHGAWPAAGSTS
jgi:diguanylate cyclase